MKRSPSLRVIDGGTAAPHLDKVEGLWMRTTKARPGRMTDFILAVRAEQTKAAA